MGIYLNPGNQRYRIALNSQIYVDKTEMIQFINSVVNTNQRYVSVSRPRRFGKTMAADMLCAYYDRTADSRELFEKRLISGKADWDRYLGRFDVIRIVMTDFIKPDVLVRKCLQKLEQRISRITQDGPLLIRLEYLAYYYDTKAVFILNNEAMGEFARVMDEKLKCF